MNVKPKKKRRWIWVAVVIVFFSIMSAVYEPETDTDSAPHESSDTLLSTELTDTEWEQIQTIFTKYVGKDIEYKPVYCGEWREGRQYKTENYAYGQFLINMDDDGYVHLVVWVQDKAGSEDRTVMYNRLEDKNAPPMEITNE